MLPDEPGVLANHNGQLQHQAVNEEMDSDGGPYATHGLCIWVVVRIMVPFWVP